MSLSRCFTTALRSRRALERTLLPVTSTVTSFNKTAEDEARGKLYYAPTIQSQVGHVREYSKRASVRKHQESDSDSSDSDRETRKGKRGTRGQTAFWRRKMRTHHQVIDLNKDGVVSWDDFEVLIAKFTELGHLSPKEISKFTDALRHVWEEEWGASGDPYIFIGQEQFLAQMEHVVNTKPLRKRVASPLPYFFNAVDRDGSGEITIDEFKIFYSCLGLSEQAAEESFASIDLNKDGKLSKKEFMKLGRDFFLSENEGKPSKLFWGPLV
ncbi:sarcoplasmic calcium-binding protein-like [Penaeus japonicus]|uniref:sarcoplasmic calcium-binding protein-like n=1 Tax=Penaeus japonicus TaxID=27405 RepID=UPI001C714D93|nr:sarcoplasmic calcium-binding protein-like [Penaeus japonicus]